MSSGNDVIISPEPLKPRIERLRTVPGNNLAGALRCAIAQKKLDYVDLPRVEIRVNGELQPKTPEALDRCLVDGDLVVIDVKAHGDNPLRTAFQIFVQVAAIVVGAMYGPWAAAAVQVAGAVLTTALFPPNHPEQLADANDSGSLRDQSNNIRRRYPMPLVLGRQRVGFDVAALGYTENRGDQSWINVIFGVHYGPCQVEDIKIGETLLADYPASDYQIEYFLTPGPRNSNLYRQSKFQENRNDELDLHGTWEVATLQEGADRAEIDITLPNGLNFTDDKGRKKNEEVAGQIQYAEVDTEAWVNAGLPAAYNKNGQLMPAGSFYINARTQNAIRRTYSFNLPDQTKQYKVRVKAYDYDNRFDDTSVWDTYWTAVRSVFNRKPINDENLSCIVLRIKSSGDLNGTLPVVSGVVTPIVPVFKNGNWDTAEPSSNMAACLRWVLTGPPANNPLTPEEINGSCETAYQLIEANDWRAGIFVTDEMSQEDLMRVCGQAGRFSTYWSGEDLCFVTDWEKPIPRQVFSAVNVSAYKYRREFQDEIHAVFVEFKNLDESSGADEVWVYADGYTAENATQFETLRLPYACTLERAFKEGRVYLAKREYKTEVHEFTAGFDGVTATYGDRIKVSHHAALYGKAAGRVVNRWFNAEKTMVTGIRVDFAAEMDVGLDYSIDVRRAAESIVGIALTNNPGSSRNLYFQVPLAEADAPHKDDLVVFGETNLVTEDVEIDNFDSQDASSIRISASPYIADIIEAAETGPIPDISTGLKPREAAPKPRIISTRGEPDGVEVLYDVVETANNPIQGFVARWRYSGGSWNTLPILGSDTRVFKTPPIQRPAYDPDDPDLDIQTLIDVEIRTLLRRGDFSTPTTVLGIEVRKTVLAPTGFDAIAVVRTAATGSSYPVIAVIADPITAGDIQYLDVEFAQLDSEGEGIFDSAGQPLPASNPIGDFRNIIAGEDYIVRGRFRTQDNWVSDWVYVGLEDPVSIPGGSNVSDDTVNIGGRPRDGVLSAIDAVPGLITEAEQRAQTALDTAISNLNLSVGELDTRLTQGLAAANQARALLEDRVEEVEADIDNPTTGLKVRVGQVEEATEDSASRLSVVEQSINTPTTGILARVAGLDSAVASLNLGKADASRVSVVEASLAGIDSPVIDATGTRHTQGASAFAPPDMPVGRITVDAVGPNIEFNSQQNIAHKRVKRLVAGKAYQVRVLHEQYGVADTGRFVAYRFDANGVYLGSQSTALYPTPLGASEITRTFGIGVDGVDTTLVDGTVYVRIAWQPLRNSAGGTAKVREMSPLFDHSDEISLMARATQLEDAVSDLDSGKASVTRVSTLETQVQTPTTGLLARTAEVEDAVSDLELGKADASRVEAVEVDLNTPTTGIKARVADMTLAIGNLNTGKADASRVAILEASVSNVGSNRITEPTGANFTRDPSANPAGPLGTAYVAQDAGGYYANFTDARAIAPQPLSPLALGKVYKVSVQFDQVGAPADARFVRYSWDADGNYLGGSSLLDVNYAVGSHEVSLTFARSGGGVTGVDSFFPANAAFGRVSFSSMRAPGAGASVKVRSMSALQDITETHTAAARIGLLETATANLETGKAEASRVTTLEAQSQAAVAASGGFINKNAQMALWPENTTTGVPTHWAKSGPDGTRVPGEVAQYGFKVTAPAGGSAYLAQTTEPGTWVKDQYMVVEGHFRLDAGTLHGAGVRVREVDNGGTTLDSHLIPFTTDPNNSMGVAIGDGQIGRTYRFSKLIRAVNPNTTRARIDPSAHQGGLGTVVSENSLTWYLCGIRPARPEEIETQQARGSFSSVAARIASTEQANSNLQLLKADASRVTTVEARVDALSMIEGNMSFDRGVEGWAQDVAWTPANPSIWQPIATYRGYSNLLRATGNYRQLYSLNKFPVDVNEEYDISTRFLVHGSGQARVYAGIKCFDSAGNLVGAANGNIYLLTSGQLYNPLDIIELSTKIGGNSGLAFPAGTTHIRLVFLANYDSNPDIGVSIDHLRIDGLDAELYARVTETEEAVADLEGRTMARWAIGAAVPGADAFIEARAELTPGAPPTSSVAIGARQFAVFNPQGQDWKKALEVSNGNVVLTGGLQAGAFIRLGNGQGWPVALRSVDFSAADGEVVSFGTDLGGLPALTFAMNNLAPLAAGETYDVRAENLTQTGFTMRAKINVPGTPSAQSISGPDVAVTIEGFPGYYIARGALPESADGVYTVAANGQQNHFVQGSSGGAIEFGNEDYQSTTLYVYARKGGVWTRVATLFAPTEADPDMYPPGPQTVTEFWSISSDVQVGSGMTDLAIVRGGSSNGMAGSVTGVGPYTWQSAGSSSGVRTATPNGQKTRVTVRPQ